MLGVQWYEWDCGNMSLMWSQMKNLKTNLSCQSISKFFLLNDWFIMFILCILISSHSCLYIYRKSVRSDLYDPDLCFLFSCLSSLSPIRGIEGSLETWNAVKIKQVSEQKKYPFYSTVLIIWSLNCIIFSNSLIWQTDVLGERLTKVHISRLVG